MSGMLIYDRLDPLQDLPKQSRRSPSHARHTATEEDLGPPRGGTASFPDDPPCRSLVSYR